MPWPIQLQVTSLQPEVSQPRLLERIEHIQELVNEASEVSRSLTGQLSPPLLY